LGYHKGFDVKKIIHTHRFVFLTSYIFGTIALCIFPVFEAKAYVFGAIIGAWPFIIGDNYLYFRQADCESIVFLAMPLLSAIEVWLCAWFMDKCNVTKKLWWVLFFFIVSGAIVMFIIHWGYCETWIMSATLWAENPSATDFYKLILIPDMIVGGLYGLYITVAIGFLYAIGIGLYKRYKKINGQMMDCLTTDKSKP
jgi:hypothetical protein